MVITTAIGAPSWRKMIELVVGPDITIGTSPVPPPYQDRLRLTAIDRTLQVATGADHHLHIATTYQRGHGKGHVLLTEINGLNLHITAKDPHHPIAN